MLLVGGCLVLGLRGNLTPPFVTELKQRVETPYMAYATISHMPTSAELGPSDGLANGALIVEGHGTVQLNSLMSRDLRLRADCDMPCRVLLNLVYYPLWEAHEKNTQRPVALHPSSRAGLTELSLGPGAHEINLELPRQSSESWGTGLSLISFFIVVAIWLRPQREAVGSGNSQRVV